jgi:hypothetical protein
MLPKMLTLIAAVMALLETRTLLRSGPVNVKASSLQDKISLVSEQATAHVRKTPATTLLPKEL